MLPKYGLFAQYWFASKFLGLKNVFGVSLEHGKAYDDNWSWEWWKLFYKLGFFHPKARWGLTRGQVTKTAPIVDAYRTPFIDLEY